MNDMEKRIIGIKRRPLAPKGGNDNVMTPYLLAKQIVEHFNPTGKLLEPCKGKGAFYNAMMGLPHIQYKDVKYMEIDEGADFLTWANWSHFDWVITNPPWSQLRQFLKMSMNVSDNVVFLCLVNAFFMKARLRDMKEANFAFKEILFIDTPKDEWPQTGFQLGAVHIMRNYNGTVKFISLS